MHSKEDGDAYGGGGIKYKVKDSGYYCLTRLRLFQDFFTLAIFHKCFFLFYKRQHMENSNRGKKRWVNKPNLKVAKSAF